MEYLLELEEDNKITIPDELVKTLQLTSGAKFAARVNGGSFVIEHIPFSAFEKGESLNRSIESLQS